MITNVKRLHDELKTIVRPKPTDIIRIDMLGGRLFKDVHIIKKFIRTLRAQKIKEVEVIENVDHLRGKNFKSILIMFNGQASQYTFFYVGV